MLTPIQITQAAKWLTRSDLDANIGNIPTTFDVARHIPAHAKKVVEGWLAELIGVTRVMAIDGTIDNLVGDNVAWFAALKPFLANAAWSLYMMQGNVSYSDTGPVQKVSDGIVETIPNQQRVELSRFYRDEASRYALTLAKMATDETECGYSNRGSGRPSIKSVSGRRKSRF